MTNDLSLRDQRRARNTISGHPAPETLVQPFLKWPGGKRWLAERIARRLGTITGNYIEPFLGGAAVFFHLLPPHAKLSDINDDLINVYLQVRDRCADVVDGLKDLRVTKKQYYQLRSTVSSCPTERAVRFLYLNRTAFAGMYRLNRAGKFNVPYGGGTRTTAPLLANGLLEKASGALQGVLLATCDFESAIDAAGENDFVYCDPTYTVAHENNGFVRYNERNFSWTDQIRLAAACRRAAERGVTVVVSNAWHASIRKLYPHARAEKVQRLSLVSRVVAARRIVHEYLFFMKSE